MKQIDRVRSWLKDNDEIALEIFNNDLSKRSELSKIKEKYLSDTVYTLNFLAVAIELGEPVLFVNYMRWFGKLSYYLNFNLDSMKTHFNQSIDVFEKVFDASLLSKVLPVYELGIKTFEKTHLSEHPEQVPIEPFLEFLLNMDTNSAYEYVLNRLDEGMTVADLYLKLIQPTLYQVGDLWQEQKISVATEHYITAAIQHIIGKLYPRIFSEGNNGEHRLVAVCAGSELHEVGLRMIADFFELAGWQTHFLGSNIPVKFVIDFLKEHETDFLAVSATTSSNLVEVKALIRAVKEDPSLSHIQIMVGGKVFNETPELWKNVGADHYAKDPEQAVMLANITMSVRAV